MSPAIVLIVSYIACFGVAVLVALWWHHWKLGFWPGLVISAGVTPIVGIIVILSVGDRRKADAAEKSRRQELVAARQRAEAERQRKENELAERRRVEAHAALQRQLLAQLNQLGDQATSTARGLHEHVRGAEVALNDVLHKYIEHRYYPFWDAVLNALNIIDGYDRDVKRIGDLVKKCEAVAGQLEAQPAALPIQLGMIPSIADVTNQLRAITEKADSNHDFASIYAAWATNHILVRGFSNVCDAVNGTGRLVASSISALADTVEHKFVDLDRTLRDGFGSVRTTMDETKRLIGDSPELQRLYRETLNDRIVSIERKLNRL